MKLSNKMYDVLKWISLVALDALGIAYKTVASIWVLPYGDEVCQTCQALSVLLGALIGISSINYNKEEVEEDE